MKTPNIIKLAGVVLVVCSMSAMAADEAPAKESRFYFHADVGPTFAHDLELDGGGSISLNTGARGDIAFGYNINQCFALEFETGALWNEPKGGGGDLYQIPFLVNAIWNFKTGSAWTPYIGIGGGGAATRLDVSGVGSDTDFTFGYQGMVGIRYATCPRSEINFGYKFFGSLEHEWTINGSTAEFEGLMTHAFVVSFMLKF